MATNAPAREVDLLRYQVAEIDAAAVIAPDEDEQLQEAEAVLADAEAHRDALAVAHAALEGAAEDAVGGAYGALAARAPFAALADRLHALQSEIAELAHDVRLTLETVVADPERLASVQARRATLQELTRKYGPTLADVVAYRSEAGTRLDDLEQHDARAAAPPGRADCARRGGQRGRGELSAHRRAAAGPLADGGHRARSGTRDAGRDVRGSCRGGRAGRGWG